MHVRGQGRDIGLELLDHLLVRIGHKEQEMGRLALNRPARAVADLYVGMKSCHVTSVPLCVHGYVHVWACAYACAHKEMC